MTRMVGKNKKANKEAAKLDLGRAAASLSKTRGASAKGREQARAPPQTGVFDIDHSSVGPRPRPRGQLRRSLANF